MIEADGELERGLVQEGGAFVAHAQPSKAFEPGERAFDDLVVSTRPLPSDSPRRARNGMMPAPRATPAAAGCRRCGRPRRCNRAILGKSPLGVFELDPTEDSIEY